MKNQDKIKVLYIDDEANNLISFKASFRFDYNVLTAISPDDALKILAEHPDIVAILCDQRMPDKTGVDLFEEVREKYPNPIRILITGYADIESVISAINRGNIFRYVKKPWTDVDVQEAIDQAHKLYVTTSMLAVKNEQLQKAYNELDKFAYSVTHDMRGPLLSVLGAIQVAKTEDNVEEVRGMMDMMEKAVLKLDTFIQSMHDYYNLKRGEIQISEIDFHSLVRDIADLYEITGKMEHIALSTKVQQDGVFRSDQTSVNIVLNNLLSNAFKYQRKNNPDKSVDLDVNVMADKAVISVRDNGIGIPEQSTDRIFDMFYRATSEAAGSGFGLYNVKDALNRINGEIEVTSVVDEGTTFKVTIPTK